MTASDLVDHVRAVGSRHPTAWRRIDELRKHLELPSWCYATTSVGARAMSWTLRHVEALGGRGASAEVAAMLAAQEASRLATLASWRVSQGIYRFDEALLEALGDTDLERVPVEVLERLPEWCVYVETPGWTLPYGEHSPGFWARLEPGLELVLLTAVDLRGRLDSVPVTVPLGTGDVLEAMRRHEASVAPVEVAGEIVDAARTVDIIASVVRPRLGLLLYLCAENADLTRPPRPSSRRRGGKLLVPDAPRVWPVGERVGASLRRTNAVHAAASGAAGNGGRHGPRAHVRRAHWHTYLCGDGGKRRELRWVAPVLVGSRDELVPVVREVEQGDGG